MPHSFYSKILANQVLLCLQSWIEHNLRKEGFVEISHITVSVCTTNQVYIAIIPHNYYTKMLPNYVPLRSQSRIEHHLRKNEFEWISYLTTNFCATTQVYLTIISHNYYAQILPNYVVLSLRSWTNNLGKNVFEQISHLSTIFCRTNQVFVTITPHNYYAQILANYVLLCL